MHRIEVSISLSVNVDGCPTEVRLWLDLDHEDGLDSEHELPLWPCGRHEWLAVFDVDPRCEQFSYRIGLRAHADAQWWVRFRSCDSRSDLLADGDVLMLPKCWLLGTCGLHRVDRSKSSLGAPRPSHLVLIQSQGHGSQQAPPKR